MIAPGPILKPTMAEAVRVENERRRLWSRSWDELVAPNPFFISFSHYLAVDIFADDADEQRAWQGYVESRLRRLVDELARTPLKRIHNWPNKEKPYTAANLTDAQRSLAVCYYIGFEIDKEKLGGGKAHQKERSEINAVRRSTTNKNRTT